jgi:hypothetical protein
MDYLCYRASPGEGFSVFRDSDEDGEALLEPDDNEVFMVARWGDTLLCPFECDRCAHFKPIGRLAVRHNAAADDRILKFVRRANLDALLLSSHEPLYPLLVLLSVLLAMELGLLLTLCHMGHKLFDQRFGIAFK